MINDSELIINADGSIYHLNLLPTDIADTIIFVGDPDRVPEVSKYFDDIEIKKGRREFITHTGTLRGKRITVISTGIGTDNIDIVINELDALVNIDLNTRQIKKEKTPLNLIRLGTSGAIQPDIPVNSFIVSSHALGIDGLLNFYSGNNPAFDNKMAEAFIKHSNWPEIMAKPYVVKASEALLKQYGNELLSGITATAPGFYGPQGRTLRLSPRIEDLNQRLESFEYNGLRISNFEMESSALYGLSALLGHNALTICVAIANRHHKEYSKNSKTHIGLLIKHVLDRFAG